MLEGKTIPYYQQLLPHRRRNRKLVLKIAGELLRDGGRGTRQST